MEVFFCAENGRNSTEVLFCFVNGGSWFLQNKDNHV
jgi:hypothetical protein